MNCNPYFSASSFFIRKSQQAFYIIWSNDEKTAKGILQLGAKLYILQCELIFFMTQIRFKFCCLKYFPAEFNKTSLNNPRRTTQERRGAINNLDNYICKAAKETVQTSQTQMFCVLPGISRKIPCAVIRRSQTGSRFYGLQGCASRRASPKPMASWNSLI